MTFWYWLLSWLPFEWAAPDTMLFMKNALLQWGFIYLLSPFTDYITL